MMPYCYNLPRPIGYWARAGVRRGKPAYRWTHFRMSWGCHNWIRSGDVAPDPVRKGWACLGCARIPQEVADGLLAAADT